MLASIRDLVKEMGLPARIAAAHADAHLLHQMRIEASMRYLPLASMSGASELNIMVASSGPVR